MREREAAEWCLCSLAGLNDITRHNLITEVLVWIVMAPATDGTHIACPVLSCPVLCYAVLCWLCSVVLRFLPSHTKPINKVCRRCVFSQALLEAEALASLVQLGTFTAMNVSISLSFSLYIYMYKSYIHIYIYAYIYKEQTVYIHIYIYTC